MAQFSSDKEGIGSIKVEANGLQTAQFEGYLFPIDHSHDTESFIKELNFTPDLFTTMSISEIDKTAEDAMDRFTEFDLNFTVILYHLVLISHFFSVEHFIFWDLSCCLKTNILLSGENPVLCEKHWMMIEKLPKNKVAFS